MYGVGSNKAYKTYQIWTAELCSSKPELLKYWISWSDVALLLIAQIYDTILYRKFLTGPHGDFGAHNNLLCFIRQFFQPDLVSCQTYTTYHTYLVLMRLRWAGRSLPCQQDLPHKLRVEIPRALV